MVVNETQAVSMSMDYPSLDSGDKVKQACLFRNFAGLSTSTLVFREQLSSDKFKNLY